MKRYLVISESQYQKHKSSFTGPGRELLRGKRMVRVRSGIKNPLPLKPSYPPAVARLYCRSSNLGFDPPIVLGVIGLTLTSLLLLC